MTHPPDDAPDREPDTIDSSGRPLIFCGMCGALNPASNFYCAACGTTLVDAFHATEGLRVFERPDSASRLVEIVASGTDLQVVEDANAPADFIRVRLTAGRLGYIRVQDVGAGASDPPGTTVYAAPDINTNARGCVSQTSALFGLLLVLVLALLMVVIFLRSNTYDQGTMLLLFCIGIGPLLLITVAIYLYARSRDDRFAEEEAEAEAAHEAALEAARGDDA